MDEHTKIRNVRLPQGESPAVAALLGRSADKRFRHRSEWTSSDDALVFSLQVSSDFPLASTFLPFFLLVTFVCRRRMQKKTFIVVNFHEHVLVETLR